ncbi:MAG: TrmJ/YjtD family RNA methyltransferase [Bryobacterales bacterium]|nr:TrmJ/YjtD family RNA methyltransferase [Bryobacterales bacterium]
MPEAPPPEPGNWRQNLRVVLVGARNSLNIGAAARAMLNFGFTDLRCVRPYELSFRSARSAGGAGSVLAEARVCADLAEALGEAELVVGCSGLEARKQRHVQRVLPAAATAVRTHLDDRRAALVFGSEKSGLTNDDLSHCDWVLSIPTNSDCPSMNLGQAVAVCCYEISRRSGPSPSLQTPKGVPSVTRERILQTLLGVLKTSGFLQAGALPAKTRKLRRFVGRLRLAPEDARMLQAILRQIEWKLANPEDPGKNSGGTPSS